MKILKHVKNVITAVLINKIVGNKLNDKKFISLREYYNSLC